MSCDNSSICLHLGAPRTKANTPSPSFSSFTLSPHSFIPFSPFTTPSSLGPRTNTHFLSYFTSLHSPLFTFPSSLYINIRNVLLSRQTVCPRPHAPCPQVQRPFGKKKKTLTHSHYTQHTHTYTNARTRPPPFPLLLFLQQQHFSFNSSFSDNCSLYSITLLPEHMKKRETRITNHVFFRLGLRLTISGLPTFLHK